MMRRTILSGLALTLLMPSISASQPVSSGQPSRQFLTSGTRGHQLAEMCSPDRHAGDQYITACTAYIIGVSDGLAWSGDLCFVKPFNVAQIVAIVRKYLSANPEKWQQPSIMIIREALIPVFPCPE